jgi:hypothetical protein
VDDLDRVGRRFDAAMLDIYHGAARLGYRPTRFLEMVQVHGGVETAHRLPRGADDGVRFSGRDYPVRSGRAALTRLTHRETGRRADTPEGYSTMGPYPGDGHEGPSDGAVPND